MFDGKAKFCFRIDKHSDSDISGLLSDVCNLKCSFVSEEVCNIILFAVAPIVRMYSESPVL